MAKRYRARRVRKPTASVNGPELIPARRGHLQPNLSALPSLWRRSPMSRHQLHRRPRQTCRQPAGSDGLAPSGLSSAMPYLRMHHYL